MINVEVGKHDAEAAAKILAQCQNKPIKKMVANDFDPMRYAVSKQTPGHISSTTI
jgi:hypothetical protein